MADKTSFTQSLMHMVKGNLGTGILAMPASFAHTGLVGGCLGLPVLCIVATYCIHILIKSTVELEKKSSTSLVEQSDFDYANLAKHSLGAGPRWMRSIAGLVSKLIDATLLVAQLGVCCVYLVFVVENVTKILCSYNIFVDKTYVFLAIYPIALALSYIRTLNRLAIASTFANLLQAIGITLILEYLLRDINQVDLSKRDNFNSIKNTALGFGSAMFAFEGVSVVLPIYLKLKCPERMSGWCGLINTSYVILLMLYFAVGLSGFLKFGHQAGDSITLNLPPTPLYDLVRAVFTCSVFLTYPLQFYVPNEIIWTWIKQSILIPRLARNIEGQLSKQASNETQDSLVGSEGTFKVNGEANKIPAIIDINSLTLNEKPVRAMVDAPSDISEKQPSNPIVYEEIIGNTRQQPNTKRLDPHLPQQVDETDEDRQLYLHNYVCRTVLVSITFSLAMVVPKLNLLMDLIGSITGTALSLIFPAIIHIAAYWNSIEGLEKTALILVDTLVITFGLVAGVIGSTFSFSTIVDSFYQ